MNNIRVRFAPAPTGFMHLGNVRTALINYLFAKQKSGTFVLRVEDTDFKRTIESGIEKIFENLQWLGLEWDEGPSKPGPYEPYYQSQRTPIYKKYLEEAINKNLVYRCFCTAEELEAKRLRQIALKMPPRYDRTCLKLSTEEVIKKLEANTPFIWRFKLDENKTVHFFDLAHKEMVFELKHFSDVPLTRQDESFTFLFANFVDDHEMKISHVFRGQDHLSNTAAQIAMYEAFNCQVPIFWHLPIIANKDGKKLSKRDFGFSLNDLISAGYLPEAICNYLAIIGGSFKKEIMNMNELIDSLEFENINPTGLIKYDIEKLNWVNHEWINRYDLQKLTNLCTPYLFKTFPEAKNLSHENILALIKLVQPDLIKLSDISELAAFYFSKPKPSKELLYENKFLEYKDIFDEAMLKIESIGTPKELIDLLKEECKKYNKSTKELFMLMRIILTGKVSGPSVADLVEILGLRETKERILSSLK